MLHGYDFWLQIPFLLIFAAHQAYMTAITIVIELLAIVFLLAGVVTYFFRKNIESRRAPLKQITGNRSSISPIIVLTVPVLMLFVVSGTSMMGFTSSSVSKSTPVPTRIATPRTTSLVSVPQDLISPGILTVGTDPSYPPETYLDSRTGLPVGFDIELAKNIAQLMGLKIEIKPTHSKNLVNGLNDKFFDVVISAYPLTDTIKGSTKFIPYLSPKGVLLVLNGNTHQLNFNTPADLCTHTIGVQSSSPEELDLRTIDCSQQSGSVNIKELPDADTLMNELINKRVDAIYQSSPTVSYYQRKYPGEFEQVGERAISQEGILMRSADNEMYQSVQAAYSLLVNSGSFSALLQSWGLSSDTITDATPTPSVPTPTPSNFAFDTPTPTATQKNHERPGISQSRVRLGFDKFYMRGSSA